MGDNMYYNINEAYVTSPICISISHKKVPIHILEKLAIKDPVEHAKYIRSILKSSEIILLQTCNRFEIYVDKATNDRLKLLVNYLKEKTGIRSNGFIDIYYGIKAVEHLFRVSSGLESLAIGETQILNQVKSAYLKFKNAGLIREKLSLMFERAILTAKRVFSETNINKGSISIASLTVELLCETLSSIQDKVFLVIGAGTMASRVVNLLHKHGVKKVIILNRTVVKAKHLAEKFNYLWDDLNKLKTYLRDVDVVISAVSVAKPIITLNEIRDVMNQRRRKHLLIIDISNPRSIDPEIKKIPGVVLKNIDDLRVIAHKNMLKRMSEIPKAEKIIEEELRRYTELYFLKFINKYISMLYRSVENIRREELKEALKAIHAGKDFTMVLEAMSKSLVKKILHPITTILRRELVRNDFCLEFVGRIVDEYKSMLNGGGAVAHSRIP